MKRLYIFDSFYPYGYSECFLEDEIIYQSRVFDEVYLVPYCYLDTMRKMPANCYLLPPDEIHRKKSKMLFNKKTIIPFLYDFFSKKVYLSKVKMIVWLKVYCSTNYLLNSTRVKNLLSELTSDDVMYFYWGKGANALAAFYNGEAKIVSRFHGQWDLWEEEYGGYAPLRELITKKLDAAIAISKLGQNYLKQKYPKSKIRLYPLGTNDYGLCEDKSNTNEICVCSCSTVYPLKRVDLIFNSLLSIKDRNIKWTHIGDGVDFGKLKTQVDEIQHQNLEVNLLGRMSHEDVMYFLKEHKFDVFVNLSVLEGVPVSIMEAISFDIPIVATNVGGTSDVVTEQSGLLVSANPTKEEVAEAILRVVNGVFLPREYWKNHYSADLNYGEFAKFLSNL